MLLSELRQKIHFIAQKGISIFLVFLMQLFHTLVSDQTITESTSLNYTSAEPYLSVTKSTFIWQEKFHSGHKDGSEMHSHYKHIQFQTKKQLRIARVQHISIHKIKYLGEKLKHKKYVSFQFLNKKRSMQNFTK